MVKDSPRQAFPQWQMAWLCKPGFSLSELLSVLKGSKLTLAMCVGLEKQDGGGKPCGQAVSCVWDQGWILRVLKTFEPLLG